MNLDERYFELWNSSKQDLCNHSLKLEQELAKLKEELLEADKLIKQIRECSSLSCETCINNVDEYLGE